MSGWLKKPIIVSAFAKQRRTSQSDMVARNAFFEMVYQEAERSDAIAGAPTLEQVMLSPNQCTCPHL